jgi:hypothetical protein
MSTRAAYQKYGRNFDKVQRTKAWRSPFAWHKKADKGRPAGKRNRKRWRPAALPFPAMHMATRARQRACCRAWQQPKQRTGRIQPTYSGAWTHCWTEGSTTRRPRAELHSTEPRISAFCRLAMVRERLGRKAEAPNSSGGTMNFARERTAHRWRASGTPQM